MAVRIKLSLGEKIVRLYDYICTQPSPMKEIDLFFLFLFVTSLGLMIAGLFKPWAVLWWEDSQNRRKVFKVYGTASLVSLIAYILLSVYF